MSAVSSPRSGFGGELPLVVPAFRQQWRSLSRLVRTRYPAFVFGASARPRSVPVFVYHDVPVTDLEADLSFLQANGYRTLSSAEFLDCGGKAPNAVFLTFDDARRNFWEVAFPLLKRFGARAALFAPTGWISSAETAVRSDFMSWDQLGACARSGLVDVQSHGHRHSLIYTSTRLAAFASPRLTARRGVFDWPLRHEAGNDRSGVPPLGTPVYQAEPLLSADFRLLEDPRAAHACQELVASRGGAAFFDHSGAMAELHRTHANVVRSDSWTLLEDAAFQAAVRDEFERSRSLLAAHLGISPSLFAYPWFLGSEMSLRRAAEAGFKAVFGAGLDFRRAKDLGGPVQAFGRLQAHWLRRLPGHGRRGLREVLPARLKDLLQSQHLAH